MVKEKRRVRQQRSKVYLRAPRCIKACSCGMQNYCQPIVLTWWHHDYHLKFGAGKPMPIVHMSKCKVASVLTRFVYASRLICSSHVFLAVDYGLRILLCNDLDMSMEEHVVLCDQATRRLLL